MVRKASKRISNREQHGESSRSNIDLLSQLPDDLLIEIIRLLPTKEAGRTSVLNKSWRNLWKQIHNINFSFKENKQASLRNEFRAFDEFLGNLNPSITKNKLILQFHCNPRGSHDKLDSCLSWAVERRVKMLALDIKIPGCTSPRLYRVPAALFQCQSLVELELRNVAPLHMHNASLPLLKGLNLTQLIVIDFNNLIESFPLLERLSLVTCEFRGHNGQSSQIRICSTMLRCLKLWGCQIMDDVVNLVIKLPSLVKISINMFLSRNGAKQRDIFDAVGYVEEVHVGDRSMQDLCVEGINKSATVKHVQMEVPMNDRKRLQGMANLISSYSNLQTLAVNFNDKVPFIDNHNFQGELDGGAVLENCLLGMLNLKTVHVCGIKAAEVKELMKDTNMDQIYSFAELSRKMKFKIVRILLKELIHLQEMWIYVATKGRSYFASESLLLQETMMLLKTFETAASPRPNLQVSCEPYDSPDWSAMPDN